MLELQDKISYCFRDVSYLDVALTHSSYTNEMRAKGMKAESNERLEFLGDAVLQLVISEHLFKNYSKHREGALTKMRQQLVCEKTLARIAKRLSLGEYINLGNGEELGDCRSRPKILADALEALIAAVYLDSVSRGTDEYKRKVVPGQFVWIMLSSHAKFAETRKFSHIVLSIYAYQIPPVPYTDNNMLSAITFESAPIHLR